MFAFFYAGTQRLVLSDNLTRQCTVQEQTELVKYFTPSPTLSEDEILLSFYDLFLCSLPRYVRKK
jgi:hypothetical protein